MCTRESPRGSPCRMCGVCLPDTASTRVFMCAAGAAPQQEPQRAPAADEAQATQQAEQRPPAQPAAAEAPQACGPSAAPEPSQRAPDAAAPETALWCGARRRDADIAPPAEQAVLFSCSCREPPVAANTSVSAPENGAEAAAPAVECDAAPARPPGTTDAAGRDAVCMPEASWTGAAPQAPASAEALPAAASPRGDEAHANQQERRAAMLAGDAQQRREPSTAVTSTDANPRSAVPARDVASAAAVDTATRGGPTPVVRQVHSVAAPLRLPRTRSHGSGSGPPKARPAVKAHAGAMRRATHDTTRLFTHILESYRAAEAHTPAAAPVAGDTPAAAPVAGDTPAAAPIAGDTPAAAPVLAGASALAIPPPQVPAPTSAAAPSPCPPPAAALAPAPVPAAASALRPTPVRAAAVMRSRTSPAVSPEAHRRNALDELARRQEQEATAMAAIRSTELPPPCAHRGAAAVQDCHAAAVIGVKLFCATRSSAVNRHHACVLCTVPVRCHDPMMPWKCAGRWQCVGSAADGWQLTWCEHVV